MKLGEANRIRLQATGWRRFEARAWIVWHRLVRAMKGMVVSASIAGLIKAKTEPLEKRIAELERRIAALEARGECGAPPRRPPPPVIVGASAEGDEHIRRVKAAVNAAFPKVISVEPRKKRNLTAKKPKPE